MFRVWEVCSLTRVSIIRTGGNSLETIIITNFTSANEESRGDVVSGNGDGHITCDILRPFNSISVISGR